MGRHDDPAVSRGGGVVRRYHHLGIPTTTPRPDETYLAKFGVFISGYESSPYGIEWMRFEADSPLPELVRTVPHVAFEVDDLARELEGHELLIAPNSPSAGVTVAFIVDNGAPVELLCIDRTPEAGDTAVDSSGAARRGCGSAGKGK
jgi:hypothetical protein